ncbi:MAG: pyroglutamyl-peptidase I [Ezakiella sp.]|nr:pyroglutamyl-peptidase I [Ezakiella sp.]MDD7472217.1 pyroglutamyl-peptidase I [Bacillota bacterium]MDY3923210.1 pyroglutamyl-peptidase I [Ezakiella sp.]
MKILVTGFDSFGGEKINPAFESVKNLPNKILNAEIIKLEIPTVINKSLDKIREKIEEVKPDVVLSVGQAGGRADITIERIGINCDDFRIPDNNGNQPIDEKIVEDGPDAYFSNLPIKAMVKHIQDGNIPASVSNSAGTFVCNHVLYGVAHIGATKYQNMRTGFIHVPFLPNQVVNKKSMPSMSLETITKALKLAIEAIILNENDINLTGGKIH